MKFVVPTQTVMFSSAEAKASVESRLAVGGKVGNVGPTSPLYLKETDVKNGVDTLNTDTAALKTLFDDCNAAQAKFIKARTALGTGIFTWDASFDMLVAAGEKFCKSEDDAAKLALPTRSKVKYALAMPLSVEVEYRGQSDMVHVRVNRAPGMKVVRVEWTTDLSAPDSWQEFDGCGAIHTIKNPAPGTYWVRACSKTATAKSEFTSPVCVIVV